MLNITITCDHCNCSPMNTSGGIRANPMTPKGVGVDKNPRWIVQLPRGWVQVFDLMNNNIKHICPDCTV